MHRISKSARMWVWLAMALVGPVVMAQQLSIDDQSVGDADGFVSFTVSTSAISDSAISVDVMTSDFTATAEVDYTSVFTTVSIEPGASFTTFDVPILDDMVGEGDETFDVNLSSPVNATILQGVGVRTDTIWRHASSRKTLTCGENPEP